MKTIFLFDGQVAGKIMFIFLFSWATFPATNGKGNWDRKAAHVPNLAAFLPQLFISFPPSPIICVCLCIVCVHTCTLYVHVCYTCMYMEEEGNVIGRWR
jgi:hypothetical protein